MTLSFLVATAIRWVGFAALATLMGSLVVELFVLPRAIPVVGAARRRLEWLALWSLVTLVATTAGELVTRVQTMAGGVLVAAIPVIPAVLTQTHFGTIWIVRFVLLALALASAASASRGARAFLLVLASALALTTSLTGHAADWGDMTLTAGVDWVHVVSVSAWTGGLIALVLAVLVDGRQWPPPLLGASMRRFSRLAGVCLSVVLVTGVYNAWVQLPDLSALWTTTYGRALSVKVVLVVGLIWWGAVNRYTVVPMLDRRRRQTVGTRCFRLARLALRGRSRAPRGALPSRLRLLVGREAGLALAVFGCTAVLVDSTPPRHVEHTIHQAVREPGSVRVTMSELHDRGGVPEGWIFAPPEGDAAHGRQVFVSLGCFACHRVRGERFPASGGAGPDLTGMGHHHPAGYLLESILNPNAVIVEGPGYVGPDGKSIMPDYRGQLSVTDLVDLVAYLKTL